jgi:hypothetical protein
VYTRVGPSGGRNKWVTRIRKGTRLFFLGLWGLTQGMKGRLNSGFILCERRLDRSLGILTRLSYPTWLFMESEIAIATTNIAANGPGPTA